MYLETYGWNEQFEESFSEFKKSKLKPARITESNRLIYKIITETGEKTAKLSGRFRHTEEEHPTVGDWIAYKPSKIEPLSIHGLIERKSRFSRKSSGTASKEQVIAANIDTIFIITALDENYSIRRLERYAALAGDTGAELIFILNKTDLCKDTETKITEIKKQFNSPVYALSALNNDGIEQISTHIKPQKTIVFLGSSGVGKSTLINKLLKKDLQKTSHISDSTKKGRHTTTSKNLILLENGAIVIDTPGLREVSLLCSEESVKKTFIDINALSKECKYPDCTHTNEPGCRIREAIEEGLITEDRLKSYEKLKREATYNTQRHEAQSKNKRSQTKKDISKKIKNLQKTKDKYLSD